MVKKINNNKGRLQEIENVDPETITTTIDSGGGVRDRSAEVERIKKAQQGTRTIPTGNTIFSFREDVPPTP